MTVIEAPRDLWSSIRDDLLSTPHLERAGIGFAGTRQTPAGRRLLLRDWAPVPDDEYLVQLGHHLEVSPAFWARHAKRARSTREALVILHSHPTEERVPRFSPSDDAGEARLIPKLHARANVPVAAMVLSPGGEQGRITNPGQPAHPLRLEMAGSIRAGERPIAPVGERFDRQVRVLGGEGQSILASLKVGVVGAGGLGSHVIQQLIHLGVGEIAVIDPDRVSTSNLSRLVGATRLDALLRRPKTHIARRLSRRVGGPARIIGIRASVTEEKPARALLTCDVIVGCTDTQWSRTVLNTLAYQHYLPVLDLGVELQLSGSMGGRIAWLNPGSACLWCLNILDAERVRIEQLPAATREQEIAHGYIRGLDSPEPAVVSINGVVASLAITEILARATAFAGSEPRPALLMYRIAEGTVRRSSPAANPACPTCSPQGQLGLGDLVDPHARGTERTASATPRSQRIADRPARGR
jgi:molybdopterin-synthase adenylyltransferase